MVNMSRFTQQTLNGQVVRLEPLSQTHLPGLKSVVEDGQLWHLMATSVPHPEQLQDWYQQAMYEQQDGITGG